MSCLYIFETNSLSVALFAIIFSFSEGLYFLNTSVLCAQSLSCVWLFVTQWTVARQAPLSMGILQTRILELVSMPSSRGSSQSRDRTQVSCITGGIFTHWATREAQSLLLHAIKTHSSVQSLSRVQLFVTPWTAACQAPLSITNYRSLLKLISIVGDAIQPSHPWSSPSPLTFNLSQHQGLFKWASSSHQVAKVLEFQFQHHSFQWIFRTDIL